LFYWMQTTPPTHQTASGDDCKPSRFETVETVPDSIRPRRRKQLLLSQFQYGKRDMRKTVYLK